MNSLRHQQGTSPLARAVHLLLLLGWLLSSQGLAPALALTAAWLDGGHAVKVGASSEGAVTVVLTHEEPARPAEVHQHDVLNVLIAVFAQTTNMDKPDHVLSFKDVEDASRMLRRFSVDLETTCLAAPLAWTWFKTPLLAVRTQVVRHTEAPTWSPGLELKVGMTLMLC